MFLGANIDVAKEADRLGIREDRAMPYEPTSDGMSFAFDTLCRASAAVRCGEVAVEAFRQRPFLFFSLVFAPSICYSKQRGNT